MTKTITYLRKTKLINGCQSLQSSGFGREREYTEYWTPISVIEKYYCILALLAKFNEHSIDFTEGLVVVYVSSDITLTFNTIPDSPIVQIHI